MVRALLAPGAWRLAAGVQCRALPCSAVQCRGVQLTVHPPSTTPRPTPPMTIAPPSSLVPTWLSWLTSTLLTMNKVVAKQLWKNDIGL